MMVDTALNVEMTLKAAAFSTPLSEDEALQIITMWYHEGDKTVSLSDMKKDMMDRLTSYALSVSMLHEMAGDLRRWKDDTKDPTRVFQLINETKEA